MAGPRWAGYPYMGMQPTRPMRSASGRFAGVSTGDVELSQRFEARSLLYLTDQITGAFRGGNFQKALRDVHNRAALVVQKGMVEELQHRVKTRPGGMRAQRGTHRLEESIMHPDNVDVNASGYVVGRPTWLDRSPAALYWRRIEEGDTKTFNSKVLFTNSDFLFGPYYAPWRDGGGKRGMPEGYPHMRMPQWSRGVEVLGIGPFPHYDYMKVGGKRATENFDFKGNYETALAAVGIKLSDVVRTK